MANTADQTPSRATYQVAYPTSDEIITKGFLKNRVEKKHLTISQNWDHYQGITFEECKPKYDKSKRTDSALIKNCTFKDCTFHKCFLGSTTYIDVTFTNCTFNVSDFMHASFENCSFTGCVFTDCTAWRVSFKNTVISADSFLSGTPFPMRNYTPTNSLLTYYKFKHQKNRLDYASELIKTASEKYDTNLIDQAIFSHKKELASYYFMKISSSQNYSGSSGKVFRKKIKDFFLGFQMFLINLCSNGGTSFTKVFMASLVIIFFVSPVLLDATHSNIQLGNSLVPINQQDYWFRVVTGIEAFMGFGYGEIKPSSVEDKMILVSMPITGFIILALFLHTLIKKVFR